MARRSHFGVAQALAGDFLGYAIGNHRLKPVPVQDCRGGTKWVERIRLVRLWLHRQDQDKQLIRACQLVANHFPAGDQLLQQVGRSGSGHIAKYDEQIGNLVDRVLESLLVYGRDGRHPLCLGRMTYEVHSFAAPLSQRHGDFRPAIVLLGQFPAPFLVYSRGRALKISKDSMWRVFRSS